MDRRVRCERHEGGKVSARRVKRAERGKREREGKENTNHRLSAGSMPEYGVNTGSMAKYGVHG